MKTLVIGAGEVGKSLYNVFSKYYKTYIIDKGQTLEEKVDMMHICFPFSDEFITSVEDYKRTYQPHYTIIHSTVPVGTSRKCGAIHSPVTGLHPFLTESIQTFTKFIGGEQASEVADYFRRANIRVYITDKPETTELMKILCTTMHGLNIEFTKEVKRQCDKEGVPFELWTLWNRNYNEGYEKLDHPEYKRPDLIPIMKKIGGHCVLNNLQFLESKFADFIRELNNENI